MMEPNQVIDQLEKNLATFKALLNIDDPDFAKWKISPEKWCALEIVCHLIDEEKEDFRNRVKTTLEQPGTEPSPIDPVGWVQSRNYLEQDFNSKKEEFCSERQKSIEYLKSLVHPSWANSYQHQSLGELSAEVFLYNWLAHDLLHIKQLTRLYYDFLDQNSNLDLSYAGKWT